jgi:hypothetical protein
MNGDALLVAIMCFILSLPVVAFLNGMSNDFTGQGIGEEALPLIGIAVVAFFLAVFYGG